MDVGFRSSTHYKSWFFTDVEECKKLRASANQQFIDDFRQHFGERANDIKFLTPDEEEIIFKYYLKKLKEFIKKFSRSREEVLTIPRNVATTAIEYFKRFYLRNSIMRIPPRHMIPTTVFLATKIEEYYVSMGQLLSNIKGDHEKAREVVKQYEFLLMNELNFDLNIWQPYRPIEGFLIDIKTRYPDIQNPEKYRKAIDSYLAKVLDTDASFVLQPNQIALLAIIEAANQHNDSMDGYFPLLFGEEHRSQILLFKNSFDLLQQLVAQAKNEKIDKDVRSEIEARLKEIEPMSQEMLNADTADSWDDDYD